MTNLRIGLGYDLHRTAQGRPLILANIQIPHDKGLAGHSDADVVLHALIDALTGAAGLPDVGQLFPNTDPQYRGIDSAKLLTATLVELRKPSPTRPGIWQIVNVDLLIIAQLPKLSPYKEQMRTRLAELLGIQPDQVNLKAKTNEHVDALGEERAIACHCVALLERI